MAIHKLSMQAEDDDKEHLSGIGGEQEERQAKSKVLDAELMISRAFEQDPDAGIAMLFHQYYAILCSHAVRYVSSKAIAEDIVSDIFFEFQSRQHNLRIATSFRAFLFTAVRHRCFDYLKKDLNGNEPLEKVSHLPISAAYEPDSIIQYEELYHDLENAIVQMPLKRRKIYIMHRFEGKKYQEIADELNLSLRTVEAHVYQAINQIRKSLRAKWLVLLLFFLHN